MKLTAEELTVVQEGLPHLQSLVAFMNESLMMKKAKTKELTQMERLAEMLRGALDARIRK